MTTKKLSVGEILTAYQKAQGFETDTALADALGVSRQSVWQWLNDIHKPSVMWLQVLALSNPGTWKEELANDLLKALGAGHFVGSGLHEYNLPEDGKKLLERVGLDMPAKSVRATRPTEGSK